MDTPKLRIAFLIEHDTIEKWQYEMISNLENSFHSKIISIIKLNTTKVIRPSITQFFKKKFWYQHFIQIDQKIFNPIPNAFEPISFDNSIEYEIIEISLEELLPKRISNKQLELIKKIKIDVLIDLTLKNRDLSSLNITKYGIWNLSHSTRANINSNFAGIFETLLKEDSITSFLTVKNSKNQEKIIFQSKSFVDALSISNTRNSHFWKTSLFISRKLEDLYYERGDIMEQLNDQYSKHLIQNTKSLPRLFYLFTYSVSTFIKLITKQLMKRIELSQWILLFKFSENFLEDSYNDFIRINPPKDRIWADPFTLKKGGKFFVFIEEMLIAQNKGYISVLEIDQDGNYTLPVKIIENDYHMSYPFLFEDNDHLYMIPETGSNKTIELYKCVDFPYKWEFQKVLLEGEKAVDTTVFKHNEKYWIFTNKKEMVGASAHEELFLYYTDDVIDKKWIAHPKNPIVSDVSCARSAGNIFVKDNKIYRPAQNCIKRYGYGLKIQEIIVLNENEYEEKNIDSIYPNWSNDLLGTHTINHKDGLTVIDALIQRSKF